jgi:hypothetical protein
MLLGQPSAPQVFLMIYLNLLQQKFTRPWVLHLLLVGEILNPLPHVALWGHRLHVDIGEEEPLTWLVQV